MNPIRTLVTKRGQMRKRAGRATDMGHADLLSAALQLLIVPSVTAKIFTIQLMVNTLMEFGLIGLTTLVSS